MKKHIPLVLAVFVVLVFIQSLFFKFTGSQESVIFFETVGRWMSARATGLRARPRHVGLSRL